MGSPWRDDLHVPKCLPPPSLTGWWFGTFFIFPYIGNNHPNWLIFFRGVQTTNQLMYCIPSMEPIRTYSLPFIAIARKEFMEVKHTGENGVEWKNLGNYWWCLAPHWWYIMVGMGGIMPNMHQYALSLVREFCWFPQSCQAVRIPRHPQKSGLFLV